MYTVDPRMTFFVALTALGLAIAALVVALRAKDRKKEYLSQNVLLEAEYEQKIEEQNDQNALS